MLKKEPAFEGFLGFFFKVGGKNLCKNKHLYFMDSYKYFFLYEAQVII